MIYWYYCKTCGNRFSWVYLYDNDCKHCTKCHSGDIFRIIGQEYREMIKE